MFQTKIRNLRDDLTYGAIVEGVTRELLADPGLRTELNDLFESRGLIVFSGIDTSQEMQLALSDVFGPLREHAIKNQARVDPNLLPGVIDIHWKGREDDGDYRGMAEIDGKILALFVPWHFDLCYTDRLNRAGVLRAVVIPPEGGRTGFADGVAMYNEMPASLRERIEGHNVIYTLDPRLSKQRFGRNFKDFGERPDQLVMVREALSWPRAIHPAVWTRRTGEKVLHIAHEFALGLENHENPEGDALLEEVCQWINGSSTLYWHAWKPDQMLIWDNWRFVHGVEGCDQKYERRTHRTTIEGDYGLGYYEDGKKIGEVQRELVM